MEPARAARQADGRAQRRAATTTGSRRCSTTPCARASCAPSTARRCSSPRSPAELLDRFAGWRPDDGHQVAALSVEPPGEALRITGREGHHRRIALLASTAVAAGCAASVLPALAPTRRCRPATTSFDAEHGDGHSGRHADDPPRRRTRTRSSSTTSRCRARSAARAGWSERTFTAAEARDPTLRVPLQPARGDDGPGVGWQRGRHRPRAVADAGPDPTTSPSLDPDVDRRPDGSPSPPRIPATPARPADPGRAAATRARRSQSARMDRRTFCTRRSDECRRPGVRCGSSSSAAAEVDRHGQAAPQRALPALRDGRLRRARRRHATPCASGAPRRTGCCGRAATS